MTTSTSTPRTGPARPGAQATIPAASDSPDRRRWLMLAVLITGQFMALLDVTIVNVAIPTIHAKLNASGAAIQLVVAGYTITYAMLLITGARLGDLRGHRNVFLAGLATFTIASLACGLAPNTGALVGARFVQGTGAALMVPQILSVIQRQFSGAARTRALGVYTATLASGAVVGQVIGGVLVSANLFGASWRPVFLVNVPVGLAAALLVPRLVPADHVPGGRRLDLAGLSTASTAVLAIVLPLVLGHQEGWAAWTWASLAAGALLSVVFVLVERSIAARGGDPLLNLRVLSSPGLGAGLTALGAAMIGYGGFLFTFALHLQLGLGANALRAGLPFAPGAAAFGAAGYWWRARLPRPGTGPARGRARRALAVPAAGGLRRGVRCRLQPAGDPGAGARATLRGRRRQRPAHHHYPALPGDRRGRVRQPVPDPGRAPPPARLRDRVLHGQLVGRRPDRPGDRRRPAAGPHRPQRHACRYALDDRFQAGQRDRSGRRFRSTAPFHSATILGRGAMSSAPARGLSMRSIYPVVRDRMEPDTGERRCPRSNRPWSCTRDSVSRAPRRGRGPRWSTCCRSQRCSGCRPSVATGDRTSRRSRRSGSTGRCTSVPATPSRKPGTWSPIPVASSRPAPTSSGRGSTSWSRELPPA